MALLEQVTHDIIHALTVDLAEFLADRFGLDVSSVSNAISDYLGYNSTPIEPILKKKLAKKKVPATKPAVSGVNTCKFKITRGNNEGKVCGTTIRGKGHYCSKHKNRKTVKAATKANSN